MRRESWWALLLLGIGGLAAADHVFASYWDYAAASDELPEAARAYRAMGLPWMAADVALPPVPLSDNAAPELLKANAALPKGKAVYDDLQRAERGEPIGDLDPFTPALRLAHAAASKSDFHSGRDWDLDQGRPSSGNSSVSQLCGLFAIRAGVRAKAGDDDGALSDLEDARRLANFARHEATTSAVIYGERHDRTLMLSVQRCLAAASGDATRLTGYRKWLALGTPLPDLARAIRGQAYLELARLRNADLLDGTGFDLVGDEEVPSTAPPRGYRRDGFPDGVRPRAFLTRYLQFWTALARATDGLRASPESIGRQDAALMQTEEKARGLSHQVNFRVSTPVPDFVQTNRISKADWSVALAFADAHILHARTGHWPTALTTPDPLGKGPLKVRLDGERLRVWSVGRNGKDEKGIFARELEKSTFRDDIVAAFPSVPPRSKESSPPGEPPEYAD